MTKTDMSEAGALSGKSPTVSVVITNYNYGRFVSNAVESARLADEIIVVDDGSTDGSQAVIDKFSGITPILQSNAGHVSAVNAGFAASHGDVVIFLDADDCLGENCIAGVKANWTPKVSKLQWGLRAIDGDGNATGGLFPQFTERHTPQWCRDQMRRQCWYLAPPTSGNAWSRAFLEWVMPLPKLGSSIWAIDDYMHILAPYMGDVVSLTDVYGEYRIHPAQMSGLGHYMETRLGFETTDEAARYAAVSNFLVRHNHPKLDALRWSQHTMKRMLLIRLGYSREAIWPLIPRHIRATLNQDSSLRSKFKNILFGLALVIPYRPLASRLAMMKFRRWSVSAIAG